MKTEQKWFIDDFKNRLPELQEAKPALILTDPPYPDYLTAEYKYYDGILDPLKSFDCKQLVFWSAKVDFPLSYSAVHIWDKARGVGTMYERIFERNGTNAYKFYRGQKYNNELDACINNDILTLHPSQKPIKLITKLIKENTDTGDMVIDLFAGSGVVLEACMKLERNCIAVEIDPQWEPIYRKRLKLDNTKLDAWTT